MRAQQKPKPIVVLEQSVSTPMTTRCTEMSDRFTEDVNTAECAGQAIILPHYDQ